MILAFRTVASQVLVRLHLLAAFRKTFYLAALIAVI